MSPPSPSRGAVVLTREPPDNEALAAALRAEGFEVLEWPAVAPEWLAPPGGARAVGEALGRADWAVFTSRRAVAGAARLLGEGLAEARGGRANAAVGPSTARALEDAGLGASLVSGGRGWQELAEALAAEASVGQEVLLLRSAAADRRLPLALGAAGLRVEELCLHGPGSPPPRREAPRRLAAVVCASPTAARRVLEWNPWAAAAPFVAIGPTTAEAMRRELHLLAVHVAASPSIEDQLRAALAAAESAAAATAEEHRP